jgi:alkylation response protein AidB-like acyl-CoA dehydrogenase
MNTQTDNRVADEGDLNVIEDALRRSGKKDSEIDSVVTVDTAQTEADKAQDKTGPLHAAFMTGHIPVELFRSLGNMTEWTDSDARRVLEASIASVIEHRESGNLFGADGKVTSAVHDALGETRFWGLPIPVEYGGSNASMWFCMRAITEMGSRGAEIIGGLLSIEELIGAAGPLIWKGTKEQREKFLFDLATGRLRSGFGGTERYVGCWITDVHTHAIDDPDDPDSLLVTGDKLFISNAWYGHLIALFVKYEGKHKVLLVHLPEEDREDFRVVNYPIHALRYIHNKGLWFKNFRVPKGNMLPGNGLAIIFHDLDRGRPAVAAGASARKRRILNSCVKWVQERITFGEPLIEREYIQYLLAMQAAYIAGTDALVNWSSALMDEGFQGDVSSMIAKTQATDWLRHVVGNEGMYAHGGRFVLGGHIIGDNLVDDHVSSVYEGPNPMLGKAVVKSMAKPFAEMFVKPLILELMRLQLDPGKLKFGNFRQIARSLKYVWANRSAFADRALLSKVIPLIKWIVKTETRFSDNSTVAGFDERMQMHMNFGRKEFIKWQKKFYRSVLVYQEHLADEDLLMLMEIYEPLEDIVTIMCATWAAMEAKGKGDDATYDALDFLCFDLTLKLAGKKSFPRAYKKLLEVVARHVVENRFHQLDGIPVPETLMPYGNDDFETWGLNT